jgi:hypothetical protein
MAAGKVSSLTAHRALDHNRLGVILCCENWAAFSNSILHILYKGVVTIKSTTSPGHAPMTGSTPP